MTGTGLTLTHSGYLRIKRRGPLRDQLAHRAYIAQQMGLTILPAEFEVDHQCMNRACWPCSDFHLCVVDQALAPYMFQTHADKGKKRPHRRKRK